MMPKWRVDFDVEIQTDATTEGMSREEAGMACGLACLRMIERWATKGARPKPYRTWLDKTAQNKKVYRNKGLLWDELISTIEESLSEVCEVRAQARSSIPKCLNERGEEAVVLAQIEGFYWPHEGSLLLDDVQHYVVITQAEPTRVARRQKDESEWFVSIGDPVRAYLTFERWKRQAVLIKKAVLITRRW